MGGGGLRRGDAAPYMVGSPDCQVEVCCGDCTAIGLGSKGGGKVKDNKLGGKLTEAPASFCMSLFDPLGLQTTVSPRVPQ